MEVFNSLHMETNFKNYNHQDLIRVWENMIEPRVSQNNISPQLAFRHLIVRAFELEGAEVRFPYHVKEDSERDALEHLDGVIYIDGHSCIVESRCLSKGGVTSRRANVSSGHISRFRNKLLNRPGYAIGMVFSATGFSPSALMQAQLSLPQTILLWSVEEIKECLYRQTFAKAFKIKNRRFFEQLIPDYDHRVDYL